MSEQTDNPNGYDAVPSTGNCAGCAFDSDTEFQTLACERAHCTPTYRSDKQHVIFIKTKD